MTRHALASAVNIAAQEGTVLHLESDRSASGSAASSIQVSLPPAPAGTDDRMYADLLAKAVRLHAELVPRQAFRLTGDVHAAEDLSQDVFVRVLQSLPRFDPDRGSMEGWLYRITMNLFRDQLRRNRLRQPHRLYAAAELTCSRPRPDELALARRLDPDLEAALRSLTPAVLDTVLLADVAGLSHREIAAMTGVARGTVASRLCRAHARLQAQLAPHHAHHRADQHVDHVA